MALLNFLLPLFFLFLGFGEIVKVSIQSTISTGIFDLITLLILSVWIIFIKKSKYQLKIPILLFILSAIFSLIINFFNFEVNQVIVSSFYLVRFVAYAGLYFVFVDIGRIFKTLITWYMFISGLVFLLIGYFQYFFFSNLKPYLYLGWDMHQFRLFSSFFDPNFAGVFLVLILIFVFILKDKIFPKEWQLIPYLFFVANFIAIILTYSRGAYLMLLISVATYSVIAKKWKLIFGLIISFIFIFFLLAPRFHLESTNLLRIASIGARVNSMKEAVYIFEQKPMGVGFNTYRYAREKFEYSNEWGTQISHAGAGVDNSFLFVLVTAGILGLISYIYLVYKIFKLGTVNMYKNKYALTLVVSLAGLAVNSLTINSLFYSFIMIWIFVLAGITESSLRE